MRISGKMVRKSWENAYKKCVQNYARCVKDFMQNRVRGKTKGFTNFMQIIYTEFYAGFLSYTSLLFGSFPRFTHRSTITTTNLVRKEKRHEG